MVIVKPEIAVFCAKKGGFHVNVHLLVNVNVPEKMTSRSGTFTSTSTSQSHREHPLTPSMSLIY